MYLVELRPGKEELYRTGDELAAAIRTGDVDVHSRIYHRATSKWISITLHPQFKAIVLPKASEPRPESDRTNWTYPGQHGSQASTAEQSEQRRGPNGQRHPFRRPLAFSITGLLLVIGVQLAFSGPRPPWAIQSGASSTARLRGDAAVASRTREATVSLASSSNSWDTAEGPRDAAETATDADAPAPKRDSVAKLPSAPRIKVKTLGDGVDQSQAAPAASEGQTVRGLLRRYAAAYDSARTRLQMGMRVARLDQLLAASRLGPGGEVTETRLGLAGAANFIRVYRQQEAAIEKSYQDSFAALSKSQAWSPREARDWYGRTPGKESSALVALTTSLLTSVDSLLGVLDAQAGAYRIGKNAIAFEDGTAAREYSALRQQITATVDSARAAGGAGSPGPLGYLLEAIGTSRLPRES
jgi:hypothetical protein